MSCLILRNYQEVKFIFKGNTDKEDRDDTWINTAWLNQRPSLNFHIKYKTESMQLLLKPFTHMKRIMSYYTVVMMIGDRE